MERENLVLPECYIDTNLVNCLIGKYANHQKGCPTVFKVMNEKLKDSFAVGVIDRDKREPKALDDFELVCNNDNLYIYKHISRPHYIIQVAPAEEVFILNAAKEVGVKLSDYGLSDDMETLKVYTKRVDAKNSNKFASLFAVLKTANSVNTMERVLNYLLQNKYSVNDNVLRGIVAPNKC